ncbi:hypothetical protein AMECASPLE_008332 [Ameca splendens]|uniref:Uncharacterized protein n=1 Tax=Ameca splendens TaxID=208324 RepID=A0ABV1A9F5_9TELE
MTTPRHPAVTPSLWVVLKVDQGGACRHFIPSLSVYSSVHVSSHGWSTKSVPLQTAKTEMVWTCRTVGDQAAGRRKILDALIVNTKVSGATERSLMIQSNQLKETRVNSRERRLTISVCIRGTYVKVVSLGNRKRIQT